MSDFLNNPRFDDIEKFESKVWLASPTMHGEEQKWVENAIHMMEAYARSIKGTTQVKSSSINAFRHFSKVA